MIIRKQIKALQMAILAFITILPFLSKNVLAYEEEALIAFRFSDSSCEKICVINLSVPRIYCLTDDKLATSSFFPLWSPNGTHLAFISNHTGFFEVYSMRADGSAQKQITNFQNPCLDATFAWMSGGNEIYVTSLDENLQTTAYIVDVETGSACTLLVQNESGIETDPSCISLNNPVLITLHTDTFNVYVIDSANPRLYRLTNSSDEAMYGTAQMSPNGKYVALLRIEPDENHQYSYDSLQNPKLYVMDVDGANLRYLVDLHTPSPAFGWSPDSTKIAFSAWISERDDKVSINVIDIRDNVLQQITDGTTSDLFGDWSPDGQHIVFSRLPDAFADWQLFMIDADGKNLQYLTDCGNRDCSPDWK